MGMRELKGLWRVSFAVLIVVNIIEMVVLYNIRRSESVSREANLELRAKSRIRESSLASESIELARASRVSGESGSVTQTIAAKIISSSDRKAQQRTGSGLAFCTRFEVFHPIEVQILGLSDSKEAALELALLERALAKDALTAMLRAKSINPDEAAQVGVILDDHAASEIQSAIGVGKAAILEELEKDNVACDMTRLISDQLRFGEDALTGDQALALVRVINSNSSIQYGKPVVIHAGAIEAARAAGLSASQIAALKDLQSNFLGAMSGMSRIAHGTQGR